MLIYLLTTSNLLSVLGALAFGIVVQYIISSVQKRRKLPPGPIGLPIVGYLPFLKKPTYRSFFELGRKYGNVFSIKLGEVTAVVANDAAAAKEVFNDDACLGRPELSLFTNISASKGLIDESGPVWKEQRRFALHQLRNLGFGKGIMEDHLKAEIMELFQVIDKSEGKPYDVNPVLTSSMSNNIYALVFGRRLEYQDPLRKELDERLRSFQAVASQTGILSIFPSIGKFIIRFNLLGMNGIKDTVSYFDEFITSKIYEHEKVLDDTNIKDYIDGFLVEKKKKEKNNESSTFTHDMLTKNVNTFFGAGSETVRLATEWLLLLVAGNPDIQKKVQQEIDEVIGKDRFPTYADRLQMPYTQAVIHELHRWKTNVPINLHRMTLENTTIQGHKIPAKTNVLVNLWGVHNDPKIWVKPEEYNPNRFLSEDGKKFTPHEFVIPFVMGKRSCPGESLAHVEVFLYFTAMLQRYFVASPEGVKITYEEIQSISMMPADPRVFKFMKRK